MTQYQYDLQQQHKKVIDIYGLQTYIFAIINVE